MSRRTEKVESLLQQEVGRLLQELELPALTTISKVEVTPDLKWSKIWVTIMGDEIQQKEILGILRSKARQYQDELNNKLSMKFVPRIRFIIDHGEEYASRINELLRKASE